MRWRVLLAAWCIPTSAAASGFVVSPSGVHAGALEVAVDRGSAGRPVRWVRASLHGEGEHLFLVPVHPGATFEFTADAFFDTLDAITAPRIVAPKTASPCVARGVELARSELGGRSTEATLAKITNAEGLDRIAFSPALVAALKPLLEKGLHLVLARAQGGSVTRTLRIENEVEIPEVPAASSLTYLYVFGETPMTTDVGLQKPTGLLWSGAGSNYKARRADLLRLGAGRFLTESSLRAPWDRPMPLGEAGEIPPLSGNVDAPDLAFLRREVLWITRMVSSGGSHAATKEGEAIPVVTHAEAYSTPCNTSVPEAAEARRPRAEPSTTEGARVVGCGGTPLPAPEEEEPAAGCGGTSATEGASAPDEAEEESDDGQTEDEPQADEDSREETANEDEATEDSSESTCEGDATEKAEARISRHRPKFGTMRFAVVAIAWAGIMRRRKRGLVR